MVYTEESRVEESSKAKAAELRKAVIMLCSDRSCIELICQVGRSIAGLQDCEKCVEILKVSFLCCCLSADSFGEPQEFKFGVKPEQFLEIADIVSAVVCENGNDSLKSAWRISVYKTVQVKQSRSLHH